VLAAASCRDATGPPAFPLSLEATGPVLFTGAVGSPLASLPLVRVVDATGRPVKGAVVHFELLSGTGSLAAPLVVTRGDGLASPGAWVLGTVAGENSVLSRIDGADPVFFTAIGLPREPQGLRFAVQPTSLVANASVEPAVVVELVDQFGNRSSGSGATVVLTVETGPPGTVVTGTSVVASLDGAATFNNVQIQTTGVPSPQIASVEPTILTSGVAARLEGEGFGTAAVLNSVTIHGQAATITSAAPTAINFIVPQLPVDCEPTRLATVAVLVQASSFTVRLRASSSGLAGAVSEAIPGSLGVTAQHPIRTAPQLNLIPAESRVLEGAAGRRCFELPQTGGRYLATVFSSDASQVAATSFVMRGKASAVALAPPVPAASRSSMAGPPARGIPFPRGGSDRVNFQEFDNSDSVHTRMLIENGRILRTVKHPLAGRGGSTAPVTTGTLTAAPAGDAAAIAQVGAVNPFRYSFTSCGEGYITINARTAWVGVHSIIVEDIASFGGAAPLNGTLDARYAQIGQEFDAVMWPLILQYFGDPLRIDAMMQNHGRIIMLFSPQVNLSGAQAFVFSCDFFPQALLPKSNEAPIFYARVPTSSNPGFTGGTVDGWQWITRSTVIHETKHLASYAERIVRSQLLGFEQPWLEEGSARLSEELYGRTFYANQWKDNSNYLSTFRCDLHPQDGDCTGRPFVMPKHFGATQVGPPGLYDLLDRSETRSVLCIVGPCADASFYGGAWSIIRWTLDHFATAEDQFLRNFTQNSLLSGSQNLEATTGFPWERILGEWSLMLATDDLPGFQPLNNRLTLPSWNLRAVFAELHGEFPSPFVKPYPLSPRQLLFGDFAVAVPTLVNGGFAAFDLSGSQSGTQIVELQNTQGGPPPSALRIAIVRVQ
jgi:hypothetical protein